MTYKEFIALAKEHYNEGGDCIVECWDEYVFNSWIKIEGEMTREDAMSLMRLYNSNTGY